jgi:hypothetical protein
VAIDKSAREVVTELRAILRSDPERFDKLCRDIIVRTSDEVTKEFWEDVRRFARAEKEDA